jgi:hypothetical protein
MAMRGASEDADVDSSGDDNREAAIARAWRRLTSFAADPSRGLHSTELAWPNPPHHEDRGGQVPLGLWLTIAVEFDAEGGLASNEGQVYHPRPREDIERAERVVGALEKGKFEAAPPI